MNKTSVHVPQQMRIVSGPGISAQRWRCGARPFMSDTIPLQRKPRLRIAMGVAPRGGEKGLATHHAHFCQPIYRNIYMIYCPQLSWRTFSNSSGETGRLNKYPWYDAQPESDKNNLCSDVSTPSAITSRSRLFAS